MHDGPSERLNALERTGEILDGEVGQRERVTRSASAQVHAERGLAHVRLPALTFGVLAARGQLDVEQAGPEAPRALGVIGGKLDQRQRTTGHRSHDSGVN